MSVDLADFTASLVREVTPFGGAAPSVTDDELTAYLSDAFWEARLDGFLIGYTCDDDGVITPLSGTEDLDRRYVALIVLYAGIRILRNQILNTTTGFRAKAGPVEFEQQNSATMLAEMLKQLTATKNRIIEELDLLLMTHTTVLDAFSVRMFDSPSYWGGPELTG